jgi:hypothetical protein
VLKEGGQMTLVIDQATASVLLETIPIATNGNCWVSFVRTPPFLWGAQRATLVLVEKSKATKEMSTGRLEWEERADTRSADDDSTTSVMSSSLWAKVRYETIPQLVPVRQANQAWQASNKIWLSNEKVQSSSNY